METIKKERPGSYGVFIKDDKIALVRKAGGAYQNKLDLPGGGIEHTESPESALKREVEEEIGIENITYSLLDVTSVNVIWQINENLQEDLHQIGILYTIDSDNTSLKKDADGLDSNGANWYLISELNKENLTPFTIYALEKLGYLLQ